MEQKKGRTEGEVLTYIRYKYVVTYYWISLVGVPVTTCHLPIQLTEYVSSCSTMNTSTHDINVSLEPHLVQSLARIFPFLRIELVNEVEKYIADPPPPIIPYKTLYAVSQWARTEQGMKSLNSNAMDPHSYTMISLLAGTTTSPERKFGDYIPPKEPEEIEANRIRERKAITALLNALLSIGGVGFAGWWAADRTGWKNEWVCTPLLTLTVFAKSHQRALFAFFAAIIVAVAEAGLYLIWQSRQSKPIVSRTKIRSAKHKKVDLSTETDSDTAVEPKAIPHPGEEMATLRHRR